MDTYASIAAVHIDPNQSPTLFGLHDVLALDRGMGADDAPLADLRARAFLAGKAFARLPSTSHIPFSLVINT